MNEANVIKSYFLIKSNVNNRKPKTGRKLVEKSFTMHYRVVMWTL